MEGGEGRRLAGRGSEGRGRRGWVGQDLKYRRKPRVSSGKPLVLSLATRHCHFTTFSTGLPLVW
jgi:hypothetical protein